jgi:hypothetical protein
MNGDMQKMLKGVATKKGWAEYNFDPPVEAEELLRWAQWYREDALGGDSALNMVEKHDKILNSISYYRTLKEKKKQTEAEHEREVAEGRKRLEAEIRRIRVQNGLPPEEPVPDTSDIPTDEEGLKEYARHFFASALR